MMRLQICLLTSAPFAQEASGVRTGGVDLRLESITFCSFAWRIVKKAYNMIISMARTYRKPRDRIHKGNDGHRSKTIKGLNCPCMATNVPGYGWPWNCLNSHRTVKPGDTMRHSRRGNH